MQPSRRSVSGVAMLMLAAAVVGFLVTVQGASAQPSEAPIPRLVVHARGIAGEPLPLGLTIEGGADGAVVIVTGLVPGMTLSTGHALGANVWQVPAIDLANTWIGPPMDFVGIVDLIAELQAADATVIHHQPIQMEWIATSRAVAAPVPTTTQPEAFPAPQQLEQDEIAIENPTARAEQDGEKTHQERVASTATIPMPRKKLVKSRPTEVPKQASQVSTQTQALPMPRKKPVKSRPTEVPKQASQVSTQTQAQQCNLDVCARLYRSFDPSDCTYQPYDGGARRTCDR
jgi:BA14K-like protein